MLQLNWADLLPGTCKNADQRLGCFADDHGIGRDLVGGANGPARFAKACPQLVRETTFSEAKAILGIARWALPYFLSAAPQYL
jgi:hypothetical protein